MKTGWPLISVVVVTYNRANLLQEAMRLFRENCTYPNLEFIISDDHSKPEDLNVILSLQADCVVVAGKNRGLGANNNQGCRQARGEYIFHMQDDWNCTQRGDWMQEALAVLNTHAQVGLVHLRITDWVKNYEARRLEGGREYRLLDFEQPPGKYQIYVYNDSPHLKRADFHRQVGWYSEDLPVGQTEDDFCQKFLRQRHYRVAQLDWRREGLQLFEHSGEFQTTRGDRWRTTLRRRAEASLLGKTLFRAYQAFPPELRRMAHRSFWQRAKT